MTPYYDDGLCVIYHGDNADVLPTLGQFDIAVTSPPYNMGLVPGGNGRGMYRPGASNKAGRFREGYDGGHGDAMEQSDYDTWQREVLALLYAATTGAVFYNHRPRVEHGQLRTPLSFDFGAVPLRQIIIWDRGTGIDVNLRNFCTRQEWIMLFAHPEFRLVDHSASGMGDVWRLGMETGVPDHPAPFPLSLPARWTARDFGAPLASNGASASAHTRAAEAPMPGRGAAGEIERLNGLVDRLCDRVDYWLVRAVTAEAALAQLGRGQ